MGSGTYQSKQRFRQGDIVLAKYPFTDLGGAKLRPAIVISNNEFNETHNDIILVPLTSIIRNEDISLIINSDDLISGRLIKTSAIRIDKIFSLNKKLIDARIGKIRESILEVILKKCNTILTKSM